MDFFTQIFESKIDRYLDPDEPIDPKVSPDSLIKALKSKSQMRNLKKKLSTKTTNVFKVLKRLTIMSLLLLNSNKFYELVGEIPIIETGNRWIDDEFIRPYYMFLKKIGASSELYEATKRQMVMPVGRNLEQLFYNMGLMRMLFRIVAKMSLLGRYYKDKNEVNLTSFINTIAVHAQKIYVSFRVILVHMIENPKVYIPRREDELIMKVILRDELAVINEEMKKLFLDKYFYPLGNGIGIKLFRLEEQSPMSEKTIMGIINDHEQTNRQREKNQLEITLFPEPGKINMKFYEQSLFSKMRIDIGDDGDDGNYDEQVVEVDEEEGDNQSNQIKKRLVFADKYQQQLNDKEGLRDKGFSLNDIDTGIDSYEPNSTHF